MKRLTILITALILTAACTKDVGYNGTDCGPILIANSMNRVGDKAYVRVTRSRYFLDPSNLEYTLTDASVSMTVNGTEHSLIYDSLRYSSDLTIAPGDLLKIDVSHPDLGSIYAYDTVPSAISCTVDTTYKPFSMKGVVIDTIYYHGLDIGAVDSICAFDFCLASDTSKTQYFMLEFEPVNRYIVLDSNRLDTVRRYLNYRLPTQTLYAMEQVDQEEMGDFSGLMDLLPVISNGARSFTFTNRHLSDTTHLIFELLVTPPDSTLNIIKSNVKVKYSIRSLSWATYTYQKAVREFRRHNSPMSEPITMWSNIEGDGTGVLGSYMEIRDSLTLKGF